MALLIDPLDTEKFQVVQNTNNTSNGYMKKHSRNKKFIGLIEKLVAIVLLFSLSVVFVGLAIVFDGMSDEENVSLIIGIACFIGWILFVWAINRHFTRANELWMSEGKLIELEKKLQNKIYFLRQEISTESSYRRMINHDGMSDLRAIRGEVELVAESPFAAEALRFPPSVCIGMINRVLAIIRASSQPLPLGRQIEMTRENRSADTVSIPGTVYSAISLFCDRHVEDESDSAFYINNTALLSAHESSDCTETLLWSNIKNSYLRLEFETPNMCINGDLSWLEIMVLNLVTNANDHIDINEWDGDWQDILVKYKNDALILVFRNRCTIKKEYIDLIDQGGALMHDGLYRDDKADNAGLGGPLVASIVEGHGGTITRAIDNSGHQVWAIDLHFYLDTVPLSLIITTDFNEQSLTVYRLLSLDKINSPMEGYFKKKTALNFVRNVEYICSEENSEISNSMFTEEDILIPANNYKVSENSYLIVDTNTEQGPSWALQISRTSPESKWHYSLEVRPSRWLITTIILTDVFRHDN